MPHDRGAPIEMYPRLSSHVQPGIILFHLHVYHGHNTAPVFDKLELRQSFNFRNFREIRRFLLMRFILTFKELNRTMMV